MLLPNEDLQQVHLESKKIASTALTAYFTALRAEIISRSTFQNTLIPAALAASAAILTLYFNLNFGKDRSDYAYLVLAPIPLAFPVLGLIWLEHHLSIATLGHFIRAKLMPQLFSASKPSQMMLVENPASIPDWSFPEWEKFCRLVVSAQRRDSIDLLPYQSIFGFFPFAVLVYLIATTYRRSLFWPIVWNRALIVFLLICSVLAVGYFFYANVRVKKSIRETAEMLGDDSRVGKVDDETDPNAQ